MEAKAEKDKDKENKISSIEIYESFQLASQVAL